MTENNDNLLYITYESAMARMERANNGEIQQSRQ